MNNRQLEIALEIATVAHKGVARRNGDPYIFHPMRVCNNTIYIHNKLQKAVAILHDVIEDTPITFEFLIEKGISPEIVHVLEYLTHDKGKISYDDYINHICENPDAILVKLADLSDNLDQGTLPNITERDRQRFLTYEKAKLTIMSKLASDYPDIFSDVLKAR